MSINLEQSMSLLTFIVAITSGVAAIATTIFGYQALPNDDRISARKAIFVLAAFFGAIAVVTFGVFFAGDEPDLEGKWSYYQKKGASCDPQGEEVGTADSIKLGSWYQFNINNSTLNINGENTSMVFAEYYNGQLIGDFDVVTNNVKETGEFRAFIVDKGNRICVVGTKPDSVSWNRTVFVRAKK